MRSYSFWGTRHHCPMEVGAYEINCFRPMCLRVYTQCTGQVYRQQIRVNRQASETWVMGLMTVTSHCSAR